MLREILMIHHGVYLDNMIVLHASESTIWPDFTTIWTDSPAGVGPDEWGRDRPIFGRFGEGVSTGYS